MELKNQSRKPMAATALLLVVGVMLAIAPHQGMGQPAHRAARLGEVRSEISIPWGMAIEQRSSTADWRSGRPRAGPSPGMRPTAELRRLFERTGVTPGRPAVAYCRTGAQSSRTYFVAKYLGYDVTMYDGSFIEWSGSSDAPVVSGSK
jgi:3-mercaptopyruvate sulfurtransferase SseA